jgi:hypothetical protein
MPATHLDQQELSRLHRAALAPALRPARNVPVVLQIDISCPKPERPWYHGARSEPGRWERGTVQEKLLFIIGAPRSGSTLLNRMLGTHSEVHAPVEPHLLTPLAHLGYYDRVERADYDPEISQRGIRELVKHLPDGESDYLDALRAYTDSIYTQLLSTSDGSILLDKTPAYALVLDFAARLYPNARYVVLTRHPMAVWSSFVDSFFNGDEVVAHGHNPLLERYVPAIARFLREAPAPICHVQYEQLVQDPETHVARICEFIGIPFEPGMINYGEHGEQKAAARGLGDPMTVAKETRPTTASLDKWAKKLTGQPNKVAQCQSILAELDPADIETWGYDRKLIEQELAAIDLDGKPAKNPGLSMHTVERRLLIAIRKRVGDNALGRLIRKVREVCNVLLR